MSRSTRALLLASAAAWMALIQPLAGGGPVAHCGGNPAQLLGDSALMVTAMMLPLAGDPLRHLLARSFARRRLRAGSVFMVGFCAPWLVIALLLQMADGLMQRLVPPGPAALVALGVALAWQVSPGKQHALNACHRRPVLAAFGFAADRAALGFGLRQAAACAGSCWALMLVPPLLAGAHLTGMLVVTLFILAERLEPATPAAWRWRLPLRALQTLRPPRVWLRRAAGGPATS